MDSVVDMGENRPRQVLQFEGADEILPEQHLRFSCDLATHLHAHEMVWGEPQGPPASWKEGAPLGNGNFGALVYGQPDNLTFVLGKTDCWDRSNPGKSSFKGGSFQEIRRIYQEGDRTAFLAVCDEAELSHHQHVTTAGMLRLHLCDAVMLTSPTLRVSLWQGTSSLTFLPSNARYGETSVEMLVSRAYQVLAIRITPTADAPGAPVWSRDPAIRRGLHREPAPLGRISWELSREAHEPYLVTAVGADGDVAWLREEFACGDQFVVAMTTSGGSRQLSPVGSRMVGEITPEGTDEVIVYLTIVSDTDAREPLAEASRRLAQARSDGFEEIARRHKEWWEAYWRRAYLRVGDPALEKWWYTSLYLCASTIEPGYQSPGLQGVWIKENVPAWLGAYVCNVNIQSVYWGLLAANRVEFLEPYVHWLTDISSQCRKDTADYFRMRGIRLPHQAGIDGYELTPGDWTLSLGTTGYASGWLTQLCWQAYEGTGDKAYLRETAYPLLKDVALFYEDYLIWDAPANRWAVEPSVFYESYCPSFECWGKNSLYELTLIYGAFERAILAAEELGVDESLRSRWREVLTQLPELPTDPRTGAWTAFDGRDVSYGGHQFSLPPVFPGELVSLWHGPEAWREQALATLDNLSPGTCTGGAWCGGQGIREIIRLGRLDEAVAAARWSSESPVSGLEHTWSSAYLQANHGPGMCSVLNDMLLLALGGVLRILPCFPSDVPAAFHSLRAPGAFLVSAEKRGDVVDYLLIRSLAGNMLRLANPWSGKARLRDVHTGETLLVSDADEVALPTQRGRTIVVDQLARPFESIPHINL